MSSTGSPSRQDQVINSLVGWRNYATAKPTSGTLAGANYNFGTGFTVGSPLNNFVTAMQANQTGFLRTSNNALYSGQTDRVTPQNGNWKGVGFDHLHLTPEGYELWASSMEPLLTQLLTSRF